MSYGDGSITELKKGGASFSPKKWRVRVYAGEDPATGRKKWASKTVRGAKADARRARDELKRELEGGLKVDARNATFGEFAVEWHERRVASGEIGERNALDTGYAVKRLVSLMGNVRLRDIDVQTVERVLSIIRNGEDRNGCTVGSTAVRRYYVTLKQIMQRAVDCDLVARNPCARVKPPRLDPVERRSLSQDEAAALVRAVDESERVGLAKMGAVEARAEKAGRCGVSRVAGLGTLGRLQAVRIGLATGMRLGEACALTWGDVDLPACLVNVSQSITTCGTVKEPKSRAGVRSVSIDEDTARKLQAWRAVQAEKLGRMGVSVGDDTPVCCSEVGGHLSLANFERWWRAWREPAGFPGLKFHELRHTQATQLLAAGVDVKTVQTRLGHSSASLTLDLYAHAVPENDRAAAALIGSLFAERKPETPTEHNGFRLVKTA